MAWLTPHPKKYFEFEKNVIPATRFNKTCIPLTRKKISENSGMKSLTSQGINIFVRFCQMSFSAFYKRYSQDTIVPLTYRNEC